MNTIDVAEIYHKFPKLKSEDVREILQWAGEQRHLPKITEFQVVLHLHSCLYDLDYTKKCIENFFTHRSQNRFLFECPTEDTVREIFSYTLITVPPERTPDGYTLVFIKLLSSDTSNYSNLNQMRVTDMVLMLNLLQHGPSNGLILIIDSADVKWAHFLKIHWAGMYKLLFYVQECLPMKIKATHFCNVNYPVEKFITVVKPLLRKEVAETIVLHRNLEDSIEKYVPKENLPVEWGGSGRTLWELHELTQKNVLDNMAYFRWQDTLLVDESKRITIKQTKKYYIF